MIIIKPKGDEHNGKRKQQKPDKTADRTAQSETAEKRKQENFKPEINKNSL